MTKRDTSYPDDDTAAEALVAARKLADTFGIPVDDVIRGAALIADATQLGRRVAKLPPDAREKVTSYLRTALEHSAEH